MGFLRRGSSSSTSASRVISLRATTTLAPGRCIPAKAKEVYAVLMYPEYVARIGLPPVVEIRKGKQ